MNFTYFNQEDKLFLLYDFLESEKLKADTFAIILNEKILGILPFEFSQSKKGRTLKFDITEHISLREYLTGTINKKTVIDVFMGILSVLSEFQSRLNSFDTIVLETDYVFIHKTSKAVSLICLPTESTKTMQDSLQSFFKQIVFGVQFDQNEDCTYVADIISFLNNKEFSVDSFGLLLHSQKYDEKNDKQISAVEIENNVSAEQKSEEVELQCKSCGRALKQSAKFCAKCGTKTQEKPSEEIHLECNSCGAKYNILKKFCTKCGAMLTKEEKPFAEEPVQDSIQQVPNLEPDDAEPFFEQPEQAVGETTVLGMEMYGETTVLSPVDYNAIPAYFICTSMDDKVFINKTPYLIGKDNNKVDYAIEGNSAISRVHAEIRMKDNEYFIVDKKSTNHIYVNDERIPHESESKLSHGDVIKLGNEELKFYLY